ncbi:substrate import-associated zinc metallohydrolase lipoprotein [Chitinophaga terrae (ex Kim and Jung 2007)]|uniref:substrate import-associated zinc metallohydrolase lipoprotein n=1 Tax=Chitinophaga terrae (ex Kim and Jung 2007) TaxID=408074 RepID=UPI00278413A3|nr:substrate import-associated zinc metallohydrolase lipoprotein [Chitinophaga terrae (ex Kim and Jung 2007)]MDQ0106823.1 substrate import-associated zinc metallohydrolase lipoprotein [Chitinophaga terrae (ex Kim and Jung 2007)]
MKIKIFTSLLLLAIMALGWSACKKETLDVSEPPVGLGGDSTARNTTDQFIYDSLTVPYNVAVYYKWLPGILDFPFDIVPPKESQVIPALKALLAVAFRPYNAETGSTDFLRRYLPKTFKMAGSAQYESNGTMILGQAEGGTAMLLYQINYISNLAKDSNNIKQMFHTMHHEFGHILNQNVMFPVAFRTISTGYTGNWYNETDKNARRKGFITAYAMSDPAEDFVEMVASMLAGCDGGTYGYDDYETVLATQTDGPGTPGYDQIKAKEAMVVDYFAKIWHIDFYSLQRRCRRAFAAYIQ